MSFSLCDYLEEDGLQPKAVETPGMYVWRNNLATFAPLLFQPKKQFRKQVPKLECTQCSFACHPVA